MIEIPSEYIHNLWVKWAKAILKEENISKERRDRWEKCFVPYKDLSEEMKELDRKIAREFIMVMFNEIAKEAGV